MLSCVVLGHLAVRQLIVSVRILVEIGIGLPIVEEGTSGRYGSTLCRRPEPRRGLGGDWAKGKRAIHVVDG